MCHALSGELRLGRASFFYARRPRRSVDCRAVASAKADRFDFGLRKPETGKIKAGERDRAFPAVIPSRADGEGPLAAIRSHKGHHV